MIGALASNIAGGFLGDRMSDLIDSRSGGDGRAIVTERTLDTPRDPIVRTGDGMAVSGQADSNRWLSPVRAALTPRTFGAQLGASNDAAIASNSGSVIAAAGSTPLAPLRRYPGSDPFSVLADIYSGFFGADQAQTGTTQYSVVPQTVGGGNSNSLLLLLILAGAGFAIWWFYFRG